MLPWRSLECAKIAIISCRTLHQESAIVIGEGFSGQSDFLFKVKISIRAALLSLPCVLLRMTDTLRKGRAIIFVLATFLR